MSEELAEMELTEVLRGGRQCDMDGVEIIMSRQACVEAADEIERLRSALALAYGYLWHVNTEPMAPIPTYSPERAAREARGVLRDLLTHEQRGNAINQVQAILGHNAADKGRA